VRRREFIAGLGAIAACPVATWGQQSMPVIGFLNATDYDYRVLAFRQGLKELGYIEDANLKIEYRWLEGQYDRLPAMVADLVHRNVDVITTGGGPSSSCAGGDSVWGRRSDGIGNRRLCRVFG
jgi:putative tryptophan/tyrosine transport system substrate-binding protein